MPNVDYRFETYTLRHQEWIGVCNNSRLEVELQMFKGYPSAIKVHTNRYNGIFDVSRDKDGTWNYYAKTKEVDDMLDALYIYFIQETITEG